MTSAPLSAAADAFLAHLRATGYRPATLSSYALDLRHLIEQVGDQDPSRLDSHVLRRALAGLHARGLGARALARSLSAWRSLFNWLARDGRVNTNPCLGLRPPRAQKRLPNALAVDAVAQLLSNRTPGSANHDPAPPGAEPPAEAAPTPWQLRDAAMFELMYSSGLRRAELIGLNLDAVHLDSAEVRVLGKGAKTRIVPVGQRAIAALRRWLAVRDTCARDPQALFVGARGARISAGVLARDLKRLAQRQGVTSHVHPHALRHSFASHVLQSSGDLRAVQEMLGHASLSTTQVYTHLDFQHLARVYDQAHPRAKRKPPPE